MISKELLSEVLGIKVVEIYKEKGEIYRYRRYKEEIDGCHIHNIYELAHICKEWAFNKGGIDITSGKRLGLDGWECLVFVGVIPCDCYEAETEPEAIFKACQWILSNK